MNANVSLNGYVRSPALHNEKAVGLLVQSLAESRELLTRLEDPLDEKRVKDFELTATSVQKEFLSYVSQRVIVSSERKMQDTYKIVGFQLSKDLHDFYKESMEVFKSPEDIAHMINVIKDLLVEKFDQPPVKQALRDFEVFRTSKLIVPASE